MSNIEVGIASTPEFKLAREVSDNDTVSSLEKRNGINCSDFDEIVVMANLVNGATSADIEPHFWSDCKNGFVNEQSPQTINVGVSGVIRTLRVHHHGSVFLGVTGLTGGSGKRVQIEVAGIPIYGRKGL